MERHKIQERIRAVSQQVPEFARELTASERYLTSDPGSALAKSRLALERILLRLYPRVTQRSPKRPMIGDMLADAEFTARLPRRILARMRSVQDLGNLGTHVEHVEPPDALRALSDVLDVLEWHVTSSELTTVLSSASPPAVATVEILPELRRRYPDYIRPEITSAKIGQIGEFCYLEILSIRKHGDITIEERLLREDLGFIVRDPETEEFLFTATNPVTVNSQRFLDEMGPRAIVEVTDLFTNEAVERVCREAWEESELEENYGPPN